MGTFIVCSFVTLLFLEQKLERTAALNISDHEIQNLRRENLLKDARAVEAR